MYYFLVFILFLFVFCPLLIFGIFFTVLIYSGFRKKFEWKKKTTLKNRKINSFTYNGGMRTTIITTTRNSIYVLFGEFNQKQYWEYVHNHSCHIVIILQQWCCAESVTLRKIKTKNLIKTKANRLVKRLIYSVSKQKWLLFRMS